MTRFASTSEPRCPDPGDLEVIDRAAASVRADDPGLDAWRERYAARHRERLAHDLGLVCGRLEKAAYVLEVGAVPLLFTVALAERGFEVEGLDVAPERFARAIADLRLRVERCDVEREPIPRDDGAFDAVVFHEIFEHLRIDPISTLGEVRRVLRPGGVLFLSTPNLRSFRGLRQLLVHGRGHTVSGGVFEQYEKLATLGHMGHVREYTVREVEEFLDRIGFRVEAVVFRGGYGRGLVGLAERLFPSWRPFFSVIAARDGDG